MKKLLSVILVLCLCCTAITALAEESYAGTWVLTRAMSGDVELTAEILEQNNMKMTMEFREDGTFTSEEITSEQTQTLEGKWEIRDNQLILIIESGEQAIDIIDGELVLAVGESTLYLTRVVPEE